MNKPKTKLDELYSLRENFSIIGLTGRTGSGCSEVAKLLSLEFNELNLVEPSAEPESIQERKYEIVYNFNSLNWKQYKILKYKNILLLLIIQELDKSGLKQLLFNYYKISKDTKKDNHEIEILFEKLYKKFKEYNSVINLLKNFDPIGEIEDKIELKKFGKFYWSDEFNEFAENIDTILKENGVIERIYLLHHTAANFRKYGSALKSENEPDYHNIYYIARAINKLIKATKIINDKKCHIVIDSLRNSSEINFFKERYSGFYLVAVKSEERKKRLLDEYKNNRNIVTELLSFDETEYKCNDFVKGHFFAPDVQNCIQKADFHIITKEVHNHQKDFISLDQQLIKLQGLIQQPGLITPSTVERCMQFAYNAKLSSGCISRQVGAVITDKEYSVKAIGWNDVPRGAVPCSVRNIKEIGNKNAFGFSQFELGKGMGKTNEKASNSNPDDHEIEKESKAFHEFVKRNYNEINLRSSDLGGVNCPYCFKTAYNKFKGDSNQVHTRSLHAEENAMLQISRYGGQPLKNGVLFTTASPCELCSKKAYQLGVTDVFYIDPYPGISRSHILKQGTPKKLVEEKGTLEPQNTDPNLHMFYGAIGRGYIKLYEPFMSQKDEISILTGLEVSESEDVKSKKFKEFIQEKVKDDSELSQKIQRLLEAGKLTSEKLLEIIREGVNKRF